MQYQTSDVAVNLGRYLSCTERTSRGKTELILTVEMETRHPVEWPFGSEFPAICNHCGVIWQPEVAKPGNFVSYFVCFFLKNDPSHTVATTLTGPKIYQGQPPHLAHCSRFHQNLLTLTSLSAELLPNAWRPFLPC